MGMPNFILVEGFSAIFLPIIIEEIKARAGIALAANAVRRCPPFKTIPRPIPIITSATHPMPKTRRELISTDIELKVLAILF